MKRTMMQVYVKGTLDALEVYQKAFDAVLGYHVKNNDGTFFHAELNAYGQVIALSEAQEDCVPGTTMQFCFHYGEGQEQAVRKAYDVLKEGAEILFPLGPCIFSPCMTDLIDRFGVRWCLFV